MEVGSANQIICPKCNHHFESEPVGSDVRFIKQVGDVCHLEVLLGGDVAVGNGVVLNNVSPGKYTYNLKTKEFKPCQ